jgi:hypothetical protein
MFLESGHNSPPSGSRAPRYAHFIHDPVVYVDCPRPFITRTGDYLLTVINGNAHSGFTDPHCKANDILVYRSKD